MTAERADQHFVQPSAGAEQAGVAKVGGLFLRTIERAPHQTFGDKAGVDSFKNAAYLDNEIGASSFLRIHHKEPPKIDLTYL
jgi:hypothetical protein